MTMLGLVVVGKRCTHPPATMHAHASITNAYIFSTTRGHAHACAQHEQKRRKKRKKKRKKREASDRRHY